MNKILKSRILVGAFVMAFALFGFVFSANKVEAAPKTAITGNWNTAGTWTPVGEPTTSDNVIIPSGVIVTIPSAVNAVASSVTIDTAASTIAGIDFTAADSTLVVTNAVTLNAPAGDNATILVDVADGSLTAGSLNINGGANVTRASQVKVLNGTIDIPGNITFAGLADSAILWSAGPSTIKVGGNFNLGGSFDGGLGTLIFNGPAAQLMGAYATYNNVVIANTTAGVELTGDVTILGTLTITDSMLGIQANKLNVTGAVTVFPNKSLMIGVGGTAIFDSTLIDSGYVGNNGTLTVTGLLSGTGTLQQQGSAAILNLAATGANGVDTFTVNTVGNTVNYTGVNQTIYSTDYHNLMLKNSGTKTISSALNAANMFEIDSGVVVDLIGGSTTKFLKIGTVLQSSGTWGSTLSGATNSNNLIFPGPGVLTVTTAPTATTVSLGTAGDFVVFSNTGISTTGTTSILGDIGTGPGVTSTAITGFGLILPASGAFSTSSLVSGNVYANDYAAPTPTKVNTASLDLGTAFTSANSQATTVLNAGGGTCATTCDLGGLTLVPGVYTFDGPGNVNITSDLTLSGSPTDVWVFQLPGNLNISSAKSIILSGGAVPANIFWAVSGTTTLQTTSSFQGNIISGPATASIAMKAGATLNGKALGQKEVTLDGNTIIDTTVGSTSTAAGTASTTAATHTFTYTLTSGTFDAVKGIINSNWVLGGTDVAELGTISSVVLSGNSFATVTITGTAIDGHNYTVAPTQAAFSVGVIKPAVVTVTVTPAPVAHSGGGGGGSAYVPVVVAIQTACAEGQMFSTTNGVRCTTFIEATTCTEGQMFSIVSGKKCTTFIPKILTSNPVTLYAFGTVKVEQGTKGEACRAWQTFFNEKAGANLVADGSCGKLTIQAVKTWQTSIGIKADGILGAQSRAKAMK